MPGHNLVFILRELVKQREEFGIAAVTDGDDGVAPDSEALGAFDGGSAEGSSEIVIGDGGQLFKSGMDEVGARLHFGVSCCWSFSIPRADVLADVAAEDVVPHAIAK